MAVNGSALFFNIFKQNTMTYLKEVFEEGNEIAHEAAVKKEGENFMIYPCGFAWVSLRVPKNDKLGKALEEEGLMTWDSYWKQYSTWVHDHNQSMLHKVAHAEALAIFLTNKLYSTFTFGSRLD